MQKNCNQNSERAENKVTVKTANKSARKPIYKLLSLSWRVTKDAAVVAGWAGIAMFVVAVAMTKGASNEDE
jgi:hypothetical protein